MIIVGDKKLSWRKGMTVADLLKDLTDSHHYAVIRINGKHVSRPNFKKILIPDNSEIFLIPLISGG